MIRQYVVSSDAGGTMTDIFVVDPDGAFAVGKAATTPKDESIGFMESLADAFDSSWGVDLERQAKQIVPNFLNAVYTGTTMLNTIITRTGKRVGLIVTKGFEHTLLQGRAKEAFAGYPIRETLHAVYRKHKAPLVPYRRIRGVTERIDILGKVAIPLYEDEVREAVIELLSEEGIEALAVTLLMSFVNPVHERRVAEIAKEVMKEVGKEVPISLSCEVSPIIREVSRMNATVVQAYAAEPTRKQLFHIERALKEKGFRYPLQIVLSYGAVANINYPRILEAAVSGPIGGVAGGRYLGEIVGQENIVCTDMGGTSFDLGIITKGKVNLNREPEFQRMYLNLPMLQCMSIGAGTGTYIRLDPHTNRIVLGPDSAGGDPGPVSYDMGNETPTVGDCDLLLGRLDPDYYLGGKLRLNNDKAYKAFKEQIAQRLGVDVYQVAEGIIDMLDKRMLDQIRTASLGYDLRDYILLGYGGAAGMHLAGYAGDIPWKGIATVPWAAAFSAFGCAAMDFAHRYSKSAQLVIPYQAPESHKTQVAEIVNATWVECEQLAIGDFQVEGISEEDISFRPFVYMQYFGQLDDVEVTSQVPRLKSAEDVDELVEEFERVYGEVFPLIAKAPLAGYGIMEIGVMAIAPIVKPNVARFELDGKEPLPKAHRGARKVYHHGEWQEAKIYEMDEVNPGNEVAGLSIIEAGNYTLYIPPDRRAYMDEYRIIWLKKKEET